MGQLAARILFAPSLAALLLPLSVGVIDWVVPAWVVPDSFVPDWAGSAYGAGAADGSSPIAGAGATDGIELFETRIRPVLIESCYGCHSAQADQREAELSLDNRESVELGGRSGPVVVPGNPDQSRLLQALEYGDPTLQMPPTGRLPQQTIDDFRRWIELGAPDPRAGSAEKTDRIASRAALHWSFAPPKSGELPTEDPSDWSSRPHDQWVVAELRAAGFAPQPRAPRGELIRRLYFDLIGLPPSWHQVEAFAADDSPAAYRKLVDQLLASPQFGERWARHWLDVARFADTKGYVFTEERDFPHAYKYRDWVIRAFNEDMPIDRFFRYQIAADLMPVDQKIEAAAGDAQHEHLAALGYVTLGRRFINNKHDIIADRIDVVFRGMMGLTAACARCHDHKFDPITDEDYYALYGIFASSEEVQEEGLPLRLGDKDEPQDVGVFARGNARRRGQPVKRGVPEFFQRFASEVKSGSGRMELAHAITHPDNPLTARVFVNRVWGHLFGQPLVRTPSDFGLRSEAPRQQAVLDSLATQFVSHDWSLKWLIRELVTSSTYCQASTADERLAAADPENRLWGRMRRRRRDFESLRDGLLSVSGLLDSRVGGESERIETLAGSKRRSLYAYIDRQNLPGLFRAFDFASPDTHCPQRPHTIVPQQALFLLNSPLVQQVASSLVALLPNADPSERIADLYRRVLARQPSSGEVESALEFLAMRGPAQLPKDPWSFGYGNVCLKNDVPTVRLEPLAYFGDNRWQMSSVYPDPKFGHLALTPDGGHPGNRVDCSAIRRWTAPSAGRLLITGELKRPSEKGDGIDALLVSSRHGLLAHWTVSQGAQPTARELPAVEQGESIDFVVSCRESPGWDSFQWDVGLALETNSGWQHWASRRDFHGPPAEPLDLWSQLAQVVLVSNEFLFID